MLELIKELCAIDGVSGGEAPVREKITSLIDGFCEYSVDPLGNLICFKKGRKRANKKVMFAAHMDEVGFIVTGIDGDGFLKLGAVGGILSSALQSRVLRKGELKCVLGGKTWHLVRNDDKKEYIKLDDIYGDIGAKSKEEAEKHVSPGDLLAFDVETVDFGANSLCGKALDDRAGCAIMVDMIKSDLEYDAYFAFTVCEEVGLRGAGPAAFGVRPDVAVVLESTTAADICGSEGSKRVTVQGDGVAVSFADSATLYDRGLFALVCETAEKNGIKYQVKSAIAGGNDSGTIHRAAGGVKTTALSVPARYIHTSQSTVNKADVLASRALAEAVLSAAQ